MKVYLVGGAVRDERLGIPVSERDWCVAGATPEELVALGYRPVGNDFPVFLHPKTGEEYALARTERKTARGYHGFSFHTDPDVTIEEDLARRDLTVNAMALDEDGQLIDPYGGAADLDAGILRHVSEAFAEDPVRVLRAAKFAARFAALGFVIAEDTLALMANMVSDGEVDALVPDRVWKETEAALCGQNPQVFFESLRACGALRTVFPEVDALWGIPQPPKWHPEIDCGVHAMMVLEQAAKLSPNGAVRFAALTHDLGKATTDKATLPQHIGHEQRSTKLISKLSARLPVPTAYRDLALIVAEFHGHCHKAFELKASTLLRLLNKTDAFRRPERFDDFVIACEADARGRSGFEHRAYPEATYLRAARIAAANIRTAELVRNGMSGADIGEAIAKARLDALQNFKDSHRPHESPGGQPPKK